MSFLGFSRVDFPFQSANPTYSFQRNKLINGGFLIDQRNQYAVITPTSNQYISDRWYTVITQTGKITTQTYLTGSTPQSYGLSAGLSINSTSAYALSTTDSFYIGQTIEANNIGELAWGTANAVPITLSFYVTANIAGLYSGFISGGGGRRYVFTYTIGTINTFIPITITIPGDVGGTWALSGTGAGLNINFSIGAGTAATGTAGAWSTPTGTVLGAPNCVSVVGVAGGSIAFYNVQFETGIVQTPFERRMYGEELLLCQRYCYAINAAAGSFPGISGFFQTATQFSATTPLPTTMRAVPTFTLTGTGYVQAAVGGGVASAVALSASASGVNSALLSATVGAGATAGQGGFLQGNSTVTQFIFSADF